MITFPYQDGCLVEDGNSATLRKKQEYLALNFERAKFDVINAKMIIDDDTKMDHFTKWWITILNYGSNPFELEVMFMGKLQKFVVKMDNDLVVRIIANDGHTNKWEVPFIFTVLYSSPIV